MAGVDVSLDPSVDIGIARGTSEDRFTTDDADDSRNVNGLDVIEDDGGLEAYGCSGTPIEDGGICDDGVDYRDPTNAIDSNVEPDLHVVDVNSLEIPSPVPKHVDGGVRAIDGDVSDGKLLVSDIEADISAVDNEVSHKTTTENSDSDLGSRNKGGVLPPILHIDGTMPGAVRG